jgi:hypothetical protein
MHLDAEMAARLLVGNLSYLLLIISMMMTRMLPLRLVAIGSGAAGAGYDFFFLADPVGTFWETLFTLVNVGQLVLIAYRNAATKFADDERAFYNAIAPDLSPYQVRSLVRTGSWIDAEAGHELIRQGSVASHLIFLRSGQADIYFSGKLVATCPPGSLIGEISISTAAPATATAVAAAGPVRYLALERSALHKAMNADPAIADTIDRAIRRSLLERLLRANRAETQSDSSGLPPTASAAPAE